MMLRHGEVGIGSENIRWAVGTGLSERFAGTLYLTNLRLVFEAWVKDPTSGYVPKTMLDLDLAYVTNAVAFQPSKRLWALRIEAGPQLAYTFTTPNAERIAQSIYQTRTKLMAERATQRQVAQQRAAQGQPATPPAHPVVYLHCRHCGTLNVAGSNHCGSCGAAL